MTEHSIEFSWQFDDKSQNIVVVTNLSGDDLISLCDWIYYHQIKNFKKLKIFFFRNKENAAHFVYMRAIKSIMEEIAMSNSYCTAHLIENVLWEGLDKKVWSKCYDHSFVKRFDQNIQKDISNTI